MKLCDPDMTDSEIDLQCIWCHRETLVDPGPDFLERGDMLIIDDLKPGVLMGKAARIPVAAAGWAHSISAIQKFMKKNCIAYLQSVEDFADFILT